MIVAGDATSRRLHPIRIRHKETTLLRVRPCQHDSGHAFSRYANFASLNSELIQPAIYRLPLRTSLAYLPQRLATTLLPCPNLRRVTAQRAALHYLLTPAYCRQRENNHAGGEDGANGIDSARRRRVAQMPFEPNDHGQRPCLDPCFNASGSK